MENTWPTALSWPRLHPDLSLFPMTPSSAPGCVVLLCLHRRAWLSRDPGREFISALTGDGASAPGPEKIPLRSLSFSEP